MTLTVLMLRRRIVLLSGYVSGRLGGRLDIPAHGRQYYRLGPNDLTPTDGLSPPWPLQVGELDPWYAVVERRLGLAGRRDNVPWLPDSELSIVLEPTPAEGALQRSISARWAGARPLLGRFAVPPDFLEAAAQTGRLLIRRGAIAREIEVTDQVACVASSGSTKQAARKSVLQLRWFFFAPQRWSHTRLLLLSRSPRSPAGLGATSGALGRYLMDHIRVVANGKGPPLPPGPPPEQGRCLYLPRFDARDLSAPGPSRGFGVQVGEEFTSGRRSHFTAASYGEMLPRPENWVMLDPKRRDAWGIPVLHIDCAYGPAELLRAREQSAALRELAEVAGVTLNGN